MRIHILSRADAAALRELPVTCEVAAREEIPAGFEQIAESAVLAREDFAGAAADLFGWRMHARAGLGVHASEVPLQRDTVVLLRLRMGPFSASAPCRVLERVDEPHRAGFTYGTLRGHPESGVERFFVERSPDGTVALHITGYSRPASVGARLGAPVSRAVQATVTRRYLQALDQIDGREAQ